MIFNCNSSFCKYNFIENSYIRKLHFAFFEYISLETLYQMFFQKQYTFYRKSFFFAVFTLMDVASLNFLHNIRISKFSIIYDVLFIFQCFVYAFIFHFYVKKHNICFLLLYVRNLFWPIIFYKLGNLFLPGLTSKKVFRICNTYYNYTTNIGTHFKDYF